MTPEQTDELLIRIDERVGTIHIDVQELKANDKQQNETLTKHQTYFKIMGWVAGSGVVLSIMGKGLLAYFQKH